MTNDTVTFSDKRWGEKKQKVSFRHTAALSLIDKDEISVLDIGCGDGLFLSFLSNRNSIDDTKLYTGIDFSEVALKKAKERVEGVNFVNADITNSTLPFADNSFNTVVALDVLEHLFDPARLVKEIYRITKTYAVIGVPNFSSLPARLQTVTGCVPENNKPHKGHVYWFNFKNLSQMLKENGFEIVAIRANHQGASLPIIRSIGSLLMSIRPQLFALSFVVKVQKINQ